jgi:hypothetical protein
MSDVLQGTCLRKDGLKVDGTLSISTSWNSTKAYPKKGVYKLDFGGKVGKAVTVYVGGTKYATVTISGTTTLDVVVP